MASSIYDPRDNVELNNIQAFLDATRGQITIGRIPPLERAALAAEGKNVRAALVGHVDESIIDLLLRLDAALDHFSRTREAIDEVLPEIKRRQQRP